MRRGAIAAWVLLGMTHAAAAQDFQDVIHHVQRHEAPDHGAHRTGSPLLFLRGERLAPDSIHNFEGFDAMTAPLSPLRRSVQPRVRLSVATAGGEPGLSLNYSAPMGHQQGFFAAVVTTGRQSIARVGVGFRW